MKSEPRKLTRSAAAGLFWSLILSAVAFLALASPAKRVEARAFCEPPPGGCIELTVWNDQACRCECPDQSCCGYYWPFVPYGCDGNPASAQRKSVNVKQARAGLGNATREQLLAAFGQGELPGIDGGRRR